MALLTVTFLTAATVGSIAVLLGVDTLRDESLKKLAVVRELKANQIENWYKAIDDQLSIFSRGNEVQSAIQALTGTVKRVHDEFSAGPISRYLKEYTESSGFADFLLFDASNGTLLFSVNKSLDDGMSVMDESFSGTCLFKAFRMSASASGPGDTHKTDFEPFRVSNGPLVSYVSVPVFLDGKRAGVAVFQLSVELINKIMQDNQDWGSLGLGETGESQVFGNDGNFINRAGSVPKNALEAMNREAGSVTFRDQHGTAVLGTYKSLKIKDLNWRIISRINRSEVLGAIRVLFRKFLFYIALLSVLVITLSLIIARDFNRPVEALEKVNEQLKTQSAAMNSAANGIIITDINGKVTWVNPAITRLTGYNFDEMVGNQLRMLNSGLQSADFFKDMWTKIMNGEVWHDEVVNRRKDGSLYHEEMTITPVRDSQGQISQFVAIKNDISERKRLEAVVKKANERMEEELNVAKEIQMSMLPLKFPAFPEREDIDVHAILIPAREVGGDFYDYYFIDEENFCFLVGDVSGKGVPAALFMAVTKALLKAGSSNERSTAKILSHVNNEISKENENSMFITVFMAILNTTTGYLVYSCAGHNPPFVMRKGDGSLQKLPELHGVAIGAMEGIGYKETVIKLNRGDALFLYTDGVTEAQDKHGDLFTEQRLAQLLATHPFNGCKDMTETVVDSVIMYENGVEHADDITTLAVHFREQTADSVVDFLFTSITNKISNIAILIGEFEEFAGKHIIDQEIIQKLDIVFDELLSNTISYAYQDDQEHEIEIKIRFYKEKLIVTIMDDGTPYNPFDRSGPDTSLGLDDREIGGLGVHLVKLLVDDYSYEYKNQIKKNITSFKKHI